MTFYDKYVKYKSKLKKFDDLNLTGGDQMKYSDINEYFCCSSHNTYLIGGQYIGHSSAEQYLCVLEEGCRHVELDVYDGSIIKHSIAPTGKVDLKDTLMLIIKFHKENKDHMPIILNIENNCKNDCDKIRLVCENILGKILSPPCTCQITQNQEEQINKYKLNNYINKVVIRDKFKNMGSITGITKIDDISKHKLDILNYNSNEKIYACPCSTISINYADLENQLKLKYLVSEKSSLGEKLIAFNRCRKFLSKTKYLTTRVYPPAANINSGNYDTVLCFSLGINYPAINFQVNDDFKQVYMSFFSSSNGYVLKPKKDDLYDIKHKKITFKLVESTLDEPINCRLFTGFHTYYRYDSRTFHQKNFKEFSFSCYDCDISVIRFNTDKLFACVPLHSVGEGRYKIYFYKQKQEYIIEKLNSDFNYENAIVYKLDISEDFKKYYEKLETDHYMIISIYDYYL
jgi:hypothetical protein